MRATIAPDVEIISLAATDGACAPAMTGVFESRPAAGGHNFPAGSRSVKLAGGAQTGNAHCNFVMPGTVRVTVLT